MRHRDDQLNINTVFTLNRLWPWSPEVPGATFDLFTRNHDLQGDCDATAALRNGQDRSDDGPGPAQGIVVQNQPPRPRQQYGTRQNPGWKQCRHGSQHANSKPIQSCIKYNYILTSCSRRALTCAAQQLKRKIEHSALALNFMIVTCHSSAQLDHPHVGEIERKDFRWSLSSIHVLDQYLHLVKDEPLRKVVESVFHLYRSCVEPNRPHFRKCESLFFFSLFFFLTHCTLQIKICCQSSLGCSLSMCVLKDTIQEVSPL